MYFQNHILFNKYYTAILNSNLSFINAIKIFIKKVTIRVFVVLLVQLYSYKKIFDLH